MKDKKTVVLGASTNPARYSHTAVLKLQANDYEVVPVGIKKGAVGGIKIENELPVIDNVHTITLYLNPKNQIQYYDYIFSLNPKRIIFNPGTENPELSQLAHTKGIKTEAACTLVLLSMGSY